MSASNAAESAITPWWRTAVVYQVYLRSFADADGDGVGDIPGTRARLPYLRSLGVDAIWVTPWYPSPMRDGGYDVADYTGIDPRYGTVADAIGLIDDAHALGIRVLADLVPNHTSSAHPWFTEALASGRSSSARARYVIRDGHGPAGLEPPNHWVSVFGGPAWSRMPDDGGSPAQWYLHLFDPSQPDLNWENPAVREAFEAVFRTWYERGIDGFRVDVASGLFKDFSRDVIPPPPDPEHGRYISPDHPLMDRPPLHELYRSWRALAEGADPPRVLLGEVHVADGERLARYVRPDEFHGAFNFGFLRSPWDATRFRAVIDETFATLRPLGAPASWVLNCHDETRTVTRYGRPYTGIRDRAIDDLQASDLALGRRRARAAALLLLALPGMANVYQGEELGLPEVEDLPVEALQDPVWERTGHAVRGRDGCRVPLPWSGDTRPFGFGPAGSKPWLPQPRAWASLTAEAQAGDPTSMLSLYRAALALRHSHPGFAGESFSWVPDGSREVLHFEREVGLRCLVNFGPEPVGLPAGAACLLRSDGPSARGPLPQAAAAWYLAR
jgi:alpha-glucosidase